MDPCGKCSSIIALVYVSYRGIKQGISTLGGYCVFIYVNITLLYSVHIYLNIYSIYYKVVWPDCLCVWHNGS